MTLDSGDFDKVELSLARQELKEFIRQYSNFLPNDVLVAFDLYVTTVLNRDYENAGILKKKVERVVNELDDRVSCAKFGSFYSSNLDFRSKIDSFYKLLCGQGINCDFLKNFIESQEVSEIRRQTAITVETAAVE